jgi:CRISPR-associated protein Cmr6
MFNPRFTAPTPTCQNAAEYLFFGLKSFQALKPDDYNASHLTATCAIEAPHIYQNAFDRWYDSLPANFCAKATIRFNHRVFVGLSDPNLLETCITLNPVYGVPAIPGSACKGLARAMAEQSGLIEHKWIDRMFGADEGIDDQRAHADPNYQASADRKRAAGMVIFHDAWWVPNSAPGPRANCPLVREVVTPHHKNFMDSKGDIPATPFDSPVPIAQIAAHGSFLFAVEGQQLLADYALDLIKEGLKYEGIGARTPEYGTTWQDYPPVAARERQ